jgi:hypothetical protein
LVLARVQVSIFSGSDFGVGGLVACCCFSAFGLTCWPVELQWLVFGYLTSVESLDGCEN